MGGGNGQPQFKRHVETRRRRLRPILLHTGKIVDRIATATNEFENLFQPVSSTRDLDGGSRIKAKMNQACNIGEIKTAKSIVVGDVERNRIVGMLKQFCEHGLFSFLQFQRGA